MSKGYLSCAIISVLAMGESIPPATAQFRWPSDLPAPPAETQPPASPTEAQPGPGIPKGKKAATPAGPAVAGYWSGQLTQVGSRTPYKLELAISANGAESKYPDLDCTGKLTRVGASKSYAFFIEIITKGAANKGGRCPDGTITLARAGDGLQLEWFGSIDANMIVAYGTLSKK